MHTSNVSSMSLGRCCRESCTTFFVQPHNNYDSTLSELFFIQYGRKHKKVAVLVPYETYAKNNSRIRLGIPDNAVKYEIKDDFEMSDSEFAGL